MAKNNGLISSGAALTAFALLFLNPGFEIPGLSMLHSTLMTNNNNSIEWGAAFIMIFVTVFLTGAVMMSKGFTDKTVIPIHSEERTEAQGIRQ